VVSVRGQAAANLLKQGQAEMAHGDYTAAAKDLDTIVTTYPSTPGIEDITIYAGFAYLHAGDYLKAVTVLAPLTPEKIKPEFRGKALFFTGMAQFSQGHKLGDASKGLPTKESNEAYHEAEDTMGTLITFIAKNPSPDNNELLEDAMYYQALAAYGQDNYDQSETDLNALLTRFATSQQKPDYLLLLGSIYAVQANASIDAKKPIEDVRAAAKKAIDIYDLVVIDPNALVQANEANMRKAETLYLVAQLELPDTSGYGKALAAFQLVHRKDDMVVLQQKRIDQLRAKQANTLENGGVVGNAASRLLDRETSHLAELQANPDPIIQALIRMAECYVSMKEPDEARTILHRLRVTKLTDDQQKEVDFQYLFSYTLGGQEDKADAALKDYLAKHPNDPQADSISVQIGAALMKRGDFTGALKQAQTSLLDFPKGKHVGEAVELESEALTKLKRFDEAKTVISDFIAKNPDNPAAYGLLVTQGEAQFDQQKFSDALKSFAMVKDKPAAGQFQATAEAFYINTLNSLKRFPEVVSEAKQFAAKYPKDKALGSVKVIAGMAMDKLNDPGAIAALQIAAKENADDPRIASFALYYVVTIYMRENGDGYTKVPQLIAAVKDLRTSFPTAYPLISQSNDLLTTVLEKQKNFDDAVALYQPLITASDKLVAAAAQNKIGEIWLAAARAMGSYQSLQTQPPKDEAQKRLKASEDAYVATLTNFPDQLGAVGDAFEGLVNTGQLRVKWGLIKDTELEDYLGKKGAGLTTPEMQARLELAKAGLVFVAKNGRDQYPVALGRMDKAIASVPKLDLTTQEADQYGQLLIDGKKYPEALKVFNALLDATQPNEQVKMAEAYYGLAATYLASGDIANAKTWFIKMLTMPNGVAWSKHAMDAKIGMAEINEQSSSPGDQASALAAYGEVMSQPTAGAENQARALLGYGRILEKQGHPVKAAGQADNEYATHYYEQVNLFFSTATPELSAEGLYLAGQAYAKAGDTADATKAYATLRGTYAKTAPDWVAKAPAQ
jgi:tetratricopeptide (TPR) repeat protein